MPDPRFFSVEGPFTVAQLAEIGVTEPAPGADHERLIRDIAPLESAGSDDLSFIDNPKYLEAFSSSAAGACIVHPNRVEAAPPEMSLLISESPYLSYARISQAFYPESRAPAGINGQTSLDPTAHIGENVHMAAGVVIAANVEIGARTTIGPNVVIGPGVRIGDDCHIGANASVSHCLMGNNVRVFAGVRIGEAGFGFAPSSDGFITVPQLGRVLIEDNVEIGANTTIDRGSGPDTVIGAGCRIDNLVQIGHNVRLGRCCILVAQVGIAGSTVLENFVVVGGQVGIAGHLTIGEGANIGAQSGVMKDLPAGARVIGNPAVPARQFMRQASTLARLAQTKAKGNG